MVRRRRLLERLMGALLIVMAAEGVEALLLFGCRFRRGLGGLSLQRLVHALVPTVVLGARGPDIARLDTKLQPPHRKPGQATGTTKTEGGAIIGTDGIGSPTSLKTRSSTERTPAKDNSV